MSSEEEMEEEKTANNITITYESLFELLRREKDRLELQKMDADFYENVVNYLKEKKEMMNKNDQNELFSEGETINNEKQLENVKRIIKDLYDRREKKIISMALDKSRTKSDIMDTSPLLSGEKKFFDDLCKMFNNYRGSVLLNILSGNTPLTLEEDKPVETKIEKQADPEPAKENNVPEKTTSEPEKVASEPEKPAKMVRFLAAVPKFLGPEGEECGPFEEEDIASLPSEIVELLVNKGRAEELQES